MGWRKQRGAWWDMLWQITQRILLSLRGGKNEIWMYGILTVWAAYCCRYMKICETQLESILFNMKIEIKTISSISIMHLNFSSSESSQVQISWISSGNDCSRTLLDASSASSEKELQLVLGKEMQRTSGNSCHGSLRTHEHANWTNCSRWA